MIWPGGPHPNTDARDGPLNVPQPSLSQRVGRASELLSTEPGTGYIHVLVEPRTPKLPDTSLKDTQILGAEGGLGWKDPAVGCDSISF